MASNLNPRQRLQMAVGALILEFADLENAVAAGLRLHLTFRLQPESDTNALAIAAAVYGSMRLKTSTLIMRRVMVQENVCPEALKLFDDVFAHAGHINDLRDKLAHQSLRAASADPEGHWAVDNLTTTRDLHRKQEYEFYTSDVVAAHCDLQTIREVTSGLLPHPGIREKAVPKSPAWRYKPQSLKLVRRENQRAPQ